MLQNGQSTATQARAVGAGEWALLTLVSLVGAVMRMAGLASVPPGLWYDEARLLFQCAAVLEEGRWSWLFFDAEPLQALFALPSCALIGISAEGLRMGAAVAGALTVPALWWFARPLWGRRVALGAALMLAVLPWHVILSRVGFRASTLPLCLVLTAGAFHRAVAGRGPGWWAAAGAAGGAGMCSYLPFPLTGGVLALYCWTRRRLRIGANWRGAWIGLVLLATGCIPLVLASAERRNAVHERIASEHNLGLDKIWTSEGPFANAAKLAAAFVWRGDPNPRHGVPGEAFLPRWLSIFLIIGLWRALRRPLRPRNMMTIASLGLFLLPSVFSGHAPHALRAIGATVPAALLVAGGAASAWAWARRRMAVMRGQTATRAAVALWSVALIATGIHQCFGVHARSLDVWREYQGVATLAAREVNTLPPGATVLMEPIEFGAMSFRFLTRGRANRILEVRSPDDFTRLAPASGPLYMLFVGRDRFGAEFLQAYPAAVRERILTAPDGTPVGVLFRVR